MNYLSFKPSLIRQTVCFTEDCTGACVRFRKNRSFEEPCCLHFVTHFQAQCYPSVLIQEYLKTKGHPLKWALGALSVRRVGRKPDTKPFKRHVGPNLPRNRRGRRSKAPGSAPDFPGPVQHRGRSDSTGPPASSSLRFWLVEPGPRPRHSTPPSPRACAGLGNHLGSPLSSGEGGREESPGSRCNPRTQRRPPPLGGGAAGTSSAASAVGAQLVGSPSRRRHVRSEALRSRAPAAGT